ncbi:protein 4.1b isoform X2 [Salminus brasiliensis]|uniref:protein 4.1b isoform X2 n=1 Tax=Salminus brasiliensis TaxID=930266 RepID=UPI003B8327C9
MFRCQVNLLDDTRIERNLEKNAVGQVLFDEVCNHLNLLERGYFGLATWDSSNNRVWLDFSREVHKQIIGHDATFTFNVKFYPPDPSLLAEDLTRYLLCLQVRTDIMTNRLPCPSDMLAVLGAYTVQSEFGDYDPDVHVPGYLRTIPLAPIQTPELEDSVTDLHRTYESMTPAQADENFLQNAVTLPLYGVDLHHAKDVSGGDVKLGVCGDGVTVYEGKAATHSYSWPRVLKISYIRNKFHFRIRHAQDATESTISYILPSYRACKRLWKVAVEHHAFFRNHRQDKYEGILQLGSRFRFRRNTHTETLEASSNIKRPGPPVAHTAIKKKAKDSMLRALRSPTRIQLDDWSQVFKFDRSRPTSIPETTYTYQEPSTQAVTKVHRHKVTKTGADEEEDDDDDVPEEEQEWYQLLGGRSVLKQVTLSSDTEKLESAQPHRWKHNSNDWLDLLYPKTSESSFWELETTPSGDQKEDYEKKEWKAKTTEESTKIVKITRAEGLQKVIEETLEDEGDIEGLQKVIIDKQMIQEVEMYEGQPQDVFVEQKIRRVEIIKETIKEVMIEESQKAPEEKIKGLEKRLLEVETIEKRLQDVEDLKVRLQQVEMLERKLEQEQREQLRDEREAWYILLDHKPLVSELIEMVQHREAVKKMEEEPPQKVTPLQIRGIWHILLELLPRSQWATHLPRAPSVEEIVQEPVSYMAVEEKRWQEEMRLREERRRSSQITTQYTFPAERKPQTDERDDWFNLLDASSKESMFGKVMELYEETKEEKVRLVEEQMSFIKMEMPFEFVPRTPEELQESDRWFLLLDPIPLEKRSVLSDPLEIRMKEEQAWRLKEEEKKRQLEKKKTIAEETAVHVVVTVIEEKKAEQKIRMEEVRKEQKELIIVEKREVQLLPEREATTQRDIYDDWFILLDKYPKVPVAEVYEDTVGLRIQPRVSTVSEQVTIMEKVAIIEERPSIIEEKREVRAGEVERKVPAVLADDDNSWFVLFDKAPFAESVPIEVSDSWYAEEKIYREIKERRIQEEQKRKREAEDRVARVTVETEEEFEMEEGEDWFILLRTLADRRAEAERRRKEEEWEKQVMVEERRKGSTKPDIMFIYQRDVKDDWFLLMDASIKVIAGTRVKPYHKENDEENAE